MKLLQLPLRLISILAGLLASIPLPLFMRPAVYKSYARITGADLSECASPLEAYPSLQSFFCRQLKHNLRVLEDGIVSPVDGTATQLGKIEYGVLLQAKGKSYALAELLCDGAAAAEYEGGEYLTLYLAPRDYHGVHVPCGGMLRKTTHIPGGLLPVNSSSINYFEKVFPKNERIVSEIVLPRGKCLLVMVGALNVGSMTLELADVYSNIGICGLVAPYLPEIRLHEIPLARGELFGKFELGSTVVLIFTPGSIQSQFPKAGEHVKFGQKIGETLL